jgi:hypothetical protein
MSTAATAGEVVVKQETDVAEADGQKEHQPQHQPQQHQPQQQMPSYDFKQSFEELTTYVEQLDTDNGTSFQPVLASLSTPQLLDKFRGIENYALRLNFEENSELQHGRSLNIFGGVDGAALASPSEAADEAEAAELAAAEK